MVEPYDNFLFGANTRVVEESDIGYDFDLLQTTTTFYDDTISHELEYRVIDQFMNLISNQGKQYLINTLSYGSLYLDRKSYERIQSVAQKKPLRHMVLLTSRLIAKGDPYDLIMDTLEDLQHARELTSTDPWALRRFRQKKSENDVAHKLINNISVAYKHHCKNRGEKKRILSLAAPVISYKEGSQIFEWGYTQFSNAKKHAKRFGPYAEPKDDDEIISEFIARYEGTQTSEAWELFQTEYPDIAGHIGQEYFVQQWVKDSSSSRNSEDFVNQVLMQSLLEPEEDWDSHIPEFLVDISMQEEQNSSISSV